MSGAILIVDDDPQLRQLIHWALEDAGLTVDTAADGREALERIARARPRLVVLDITLPGVDGYGVAEALKSSPGAPVPIVVITADGSAAAKASRVGAFTYLRKPFGMADLVAAVRSGLG